MSRENIEIVRRCTEAMNRRDRSTIFELCDPDIEVDLSRNIFNPAIYRGQSGFEQFLSAVEDVWGDFHVVLGELIDAGDKVVAAVTIRGKGKGSGVEVEMQIFQVWTFRDSKAVRLVGGYRDRAEALTAAGMPEQAHSGSP